MGLFFDFTATGIKRWLYRYKIDGKWNKYVLGRYPEMSLKEARLAHIESRALVKQGLNPANAKENKRQENIAKERDERDKRSRSFECVASEWIAHQKDTWSVNHAEGVSSTLEKNVFPFLGKESVESIKPPEVLTVLRRIEKRGSLEIARKVLQRMNAVFRYAIQTGRATYNPAADMQGALKTKSVVHMPSVVDSDLSQLLKDITANQKIHITTKLALHFTALTACRSGEVRNATWDEVDLEQKTWSVPAERMKMRRPHIVPLSKQALAVIERAGVLFGTEGYIFPSVRNFEKPMSDNAMGKALRDMGYQGKATPHGFRASFSTMGHERSGFASEVIEKALAHEEKNKIKGAYNRAEYIEQRRKLLQWWGDKLQVLEHGAEIIQVNKTK